jgi:hypothetical protein
LDSNWYLLCFSLDRLVVLLKRLNRCGIPHQKTRYF